MNKLFLAVAASALLTTTAQSQAAVAKTAAAPRVVIVKMVEKSPTEFAFEPAQVTVKTGDVVRFVQTGAMPHNVEFRDLPAGVDLGAARTSAYLSAKDETYEVKIDGRFAKGLYNYVCVPHEAMGMKGTITVSGGGTASR